MSPLTKGEAHQRWKASDHDGYTEGEPRSEYLFRLINNIPEANPKILEIGCNVGRNLNALFKMGFNDLHGIEINPNTIRHREKHYPELSQVAKFQYLPLEEFILGAPTYDIVYTMAVLEHIHPDSEWVFNHFADLLNENGKLIIIEDEKNYIGLDFVYARSYENIFPGLKEVHKEDASHVPGLKDGYITRIFVKC